MQHSGLEFHRTGYKTKYFDNFHLLRSASGSAGLAEAVEVVVAVAELVEATEVWKIEKLKFIQSGEKLETTELS